MLVKAVLYKPASISIVTRIEPANVKLAANSESLC